jgi:polyisoprenoid-binding protein YceI
MKNFLTAAFLVWCTAQSAIALVVSGAGDVRVLAHGPAGLRVEGRSAEVSVDDEISALVFRVPIAPIDTGIGLRNRHLREALEVEKFPVATLRVQRDRLVAPGAEASDGLAIGELTLHGRTRPVGIHYRAQRAAALTRVRGSLQIDVRDFGIELPSYAGIGVSPEVEIEVELSLDLK